MLQTLRRIFRTPRRRALDSAGSGRRWETMKVAQNPRADILSGNRTLARRAQHIVNNNSWAASGTAAIQHSLIGSGIRPQSRHPDPEARKAVNALFGRWTEQSDAAGVTDFYGQQSMIARALVTPGEIFARHRITPSGGGLEVPYQIELIAAEQVDNGLHRDMANGARIRAGVEFDAAGRRTAYHITGNRPGDPLATSFAPIRVPASEIMHVFEPQVPGQVRGVSRLMTVLTRLFDLDQYEDAELMRKKVAALFAGFITPGQDVDGAPLIKRSPDAEGWEAPSLEPGLMALLPAGSDIKFSNPTEVGTSFEPFMTNYLHAIAAGIGCTFEQLTGIMTGVNFSSARVARIEFQRKIRATQEQVLIPQFCRPAWRRFIRMAVLSGALPAPGFERDPRPWLACEWALPGFDWVDPEKAVKADALAVEKKFKSRSGVIAARGADPEQVDQEIADDAARAARLGLSPVPDSPPAKPDNEGDRDDDDA